RDARRSRCAGLPSRFRSARSRRESSPAGLRGPDEFLSRPLRLYRSLPPWEYRPFWKQGDKKEPLHKRAPSEGEKAKPHETLISTTGLSGGRAMMCPANEVRYGLLTCVVVLKDH